MRALQRRCASRPVFRTLAGSVVVCEPRLARRALIDTDGRLDDVPAFWRPGEVALPALQRSALNRWVHTALAEQDPARVAATAVDAVTAARGDLHRACLHAVATAHRGPLGLDRDPGLRVTVTRFLDTVFHGLVTGTRRPDPAAFRRLADSAGAAVGAGAVPELPDLDPSVRGEVYLRAVTAFVGASSAALAWLLCLLGPGDLVAARRPPRPAREYAPEHVALEALRLWPPAWQHRRGVLHDHRLGPLDVLRGDELVVPVHALHRHPDQWTDPELFDPDRWAGRRPDAFLPFAIGPGTCVGARFEVRWLAAAVENLAARPAVAMTRRGDTPCVTAVFSPPEHDLGGPQSSRSSA
ncbi:hypothetical protein BLA60_33860 [Actinophytocola xinjiangensis]|uniref:Cytochrome P450 n=1 Tax=Actinophytocola xinjiangensis TaxID=485602 RepID=A0A7Z0WFC9_9PSEU|nr:cytochrome P450 [Actinophytocola xinjiangensis]OLF06032.1 hypothetical protein BLA60_33860 [Actinophytocola xinjiangensis]